MPFRIISKRRLKEYAKTYPTARAGLNVWQVRIKSILPTNLVELRQTFPSADLVSRLTVFNIAGNNYRLIVRIEYEREEIYIRHFLTHAEYDKGDWKDDDWF